MVWRSLKGRRLLGKKFRRQSSIGRYIVDFYCPEARLIVKLDGERHFSPTIENYEEERTKYLQEEGLRIIRFENRELLDDIDAVLETIKEALSQQDL